MKKSLLFSIVAMVLFLVSCENSSSQYVKFNNLENGEKPEIIFLKSEKQSLASREVEMQKNLIKEIGGKKKIILIKTDYKDYYLFGGEIIFVPATEENTLQVKFISSTDRHLKSREKEIEKKVVEEIKKIENIKTIQSIRNSGHVVGAEIYY